LHAHPERWTSDYRLVESILDENAPTVTAASFVVEHGQPGAQNA
jgi:alkaline phosphatase D